MGFVDIQPDADLGGYPLISTIVGAATRWQALSDSNDATYVKQETASSPDGLDIIGFANPTIPAGAVVTGAEIHGRSAYVYPNVVFGFGLQCNPKPAYISPWGPDPFALSQTPLNADVGAWFFNSTADGNPHDWVVQYKSTFQYNNGLYAWDQLTWNQVDLNSMRLLVGFHTPFSGTCRIHKVFMRVFYDQPPTVSAIQPTDLSAGQTFTTTPTIKWTYADTEGQVQKQYRLKVVSSTTVDGSGITAGTAGFNPDTAVSVAYDSGVVPGATDRATVTPRGLVNLANYYAYVKVYQVPIQGNEMASPWTASAVFQVNGVAPSVPGITVSVDNTNQRNIIEVFQGSWTATPYPNYIDVYKVYGGSIPDDYLRGGINLSKMQAIRTGSDAGNDITTPNHASLNITGDMDIRSCIGLEGTPPSQGHYILSKADVTFGTSYFLRMKQDFNLEFQWWNGTTLQVATSTVPVPVPAVGVPFWVRADQTVAAPWKVDFYYSLQPSSTSPAAVTWTLLSTFTGSGSGTKTTTNAIMSINRTSVSLASGFRTYYAEVRGSTDVIVANPDWRGFPIGTTTNTDSTGKVWTINRSGIFQNFAFARLYDYEDLPNTGRFYVANAVTVAAGSPVASASGVALSSGYTAVQPYTWWLKTVLDPTLNKAFQILPGSWDSNRPAETAAFTPLGRSYKVVVSDGVKGNEQTLEVECFNQADYDALRNIYAAQQVVLVQTVGHQRYLAFLGWKDNRGTIANGYATIQLDAIEVDRPAVT